MGSLELPETRCDISADIFNVTLTGKCIYYLHQQHPDQRHPVLQNDMFL